MKQNRKTAKLKSPPNIPCIWYVHMYIFKWLLYKCVKYIGLLVSLHLLGYPIVYNIDMVTLYLCLHMYDDICRALTNG